MHPSVLTFPTLSALTKKSLNNASSSRYLPAYSSRLNISVASSVFDPEALKGIQCLKILISCPTWLLSSLNLLWWITSMFRNMKETLRKPNTSKLVQQTFSGFDKWKIFPDLLQLEQL
jgi:hypothetical protein